MSSKKCKRLVIGLLIVVLFSCLITTAVATSEPNGYVVSEMTLYSGPSYNASSYATLSSGTGLCVYGRYNQWYEVGWNGKNQRSVDFSMKLHNNTDYKFL